MVESIHDPGRLTKIQEEELAITAQDQEIQKELEEDLAKLDKE